ncbi:MAG: DNA cytosine methyltransferase, partial [Acidobacteriaceae bacterium]
AGIDVDAQGCEDFRRITGAAAIEMDLFAREDYIAFHGHEPTADWSEATSYDIWRATDGETPDVVFLSAPCKGFSGLLPQQCAAGDKYQALNRLAVRGLRLTIEAFEDELPSLILFENVPRIQTRGHALLAEIRAMLTRVGYVFDDRTHDCGELGGLAQHRRRYLLIARLPQKLDSFVRLPSKRRVHAIGEVIGLLPMPDDPAGGPMHRMPRLAWKTWIRLALIPAGGDWRDLQRIDHTAYRLEYTPRGAGAMGVQTWDEPSGAVTGAAGWGRSNAPTAIADPRFVNDEKTRHTTHYRVTRWTEPSGTVTGATHVANGLISVADPRVKAQGHPGGYGVLDWGKAAPTIRGAARIMNTSASIADPRLSGDSRYTNKFELHGWNQAATTVTGTPDIQSGAPSIADPRLGCAPRSGSYGVQAWDVPAKTVIGAGDIHASAGAIADPRVPDDAENGVWIIIAEDGTWHRPLTTYELAMLQGFPTHLPSGEAFQLVGKSDAKWRERIGNAVPPPAARAIAGEALRALMAQSEGVWLMDAAEIWVAPANDRNPGNHLEVTPNG